MLTGPCLAHQTNLLLKDLMLLKSFSDAMKQVIVVATFVRGSIAFRCALCSYKQVESIAMWLLMETHWYSITTTLKQVLNLKQDMQVSDYILFYSHV